MKASAAVGWKKYEPLFSSIPKKDIYVKMIEQQHSYLFIFYVTGLCMS